MRQGTVAAGFGRPRLLVRPCAAIWACHDQATEPRAIPAASQATQGDGQVGVMQFTAQDTHYRAHDNGAAFDVIL